MNGGGPRDISAARSNALRSPAGGLDRDTVLALLRPFGFEDAITIAQTQLTGPFKAPVIPRNFPYAAILLGRTLSTATAANAQSAVNKVRDAFAVFERVGVEGLAALLATVSGPTGPIATAISGADFGAARGFV